MARISRRTFFGGLLGTVGVWLGARTAPAARPKPIKAPQKLRRTTRTYDHTDSPARNKVVASVFDPQTGTWRVQAPTQNTPGEKGRPPVG
jgi:hypothetical protein